jgi:hypothetical protein
MMELAPRVRRLVAVMMGFVATRLLMLTTMQQPGAPR